VPGGVLVAVATFLLLNVLVGLVRVLLGPSTRDRLLGVILLGTTGVALLAVLAEVTGIPALRDAALALVALAALVVVVRVRAEERRS
jgi:multicomponent Na+:H+ antiporter subunit F